MQAIQTKYHGPTNTRPGRIRVTAAAMAITVAWDHGMNIDSNHRAAAMKLIDKLGWNEPGYGNLASGTLADGSFVHVLTGRDGIGG